MSKVVGKQWTFYLVKDPYTSSSCMPLVLKENLLDKKLWRKSFGWFSKNPKTSSSSKPLAKILFKQFWDTLGSQFSEREFQQDFAQNFHFLVSSKHLHFKVMLFYLSTGPIGASLDSSSAIRLSSLVSTISGFCDSAIAAW